MGYGITWREGRVLRAHQAAWLNAGREQPSGYDIHHRCANRLCWNVDHLELVPHDVHSSLHPKLGDACPKGHPYPESLRRTRRECAVTVSVSVADARPSHDL
jgi:hypothetical protein